MRYLICCVVIMFFLVGCGKKAESKKRFVPNKEGLELVEADQMLAQPVEDSVEIVSDEEPVVNMMIDPTAQVQEAAQVVSAADLPQAKTIQTALKNLGLYRGSVDGKVGPKTKAAIREFQRSNNLVVDGKVGPKTWALLKEGLGAASPED